MLFLDDCKHLEQFDDVAEFASMVWDSIRTLFNESWQMEAFMLSDLSLIRVAGFRVSVLPPGWSPPPGLTQKDTFCFQ